jgi:choline dehydrogenase-like flavoprotein
MHTTLDNPSPAALKTVFDVCVFGTGPAGITVALELAAGGKKVALVEAGSFDYSEDSQQIYSGTESGINNWNALKFKRLRFFGGTSGHWAGRCGIFDEIDFAPNPYHGMSGWPIARQAVLEHLPQAHDILDLGPQKIAARPIAKAANSPFLHAGVALSAPTRFGQKYRTAVVDSPAIQLFTRANLVELHVAARSGGAAGIDHAVLKNYAGQTFKIVAGRYVLALGAVENARLLLNSDKQVRGGIGNHSGYVGRCFMEHLNVEFGRFVVRDPAFFGGKSAELVPTPEFAQSQRIGNGVLALDSTYEPRDYGRFMEVKRVLREGVCEFETVRDFARTFKDFNCAGEGVITSLLEQAPNPNSRVTLINDVDPLGLRRVNLHWEINDADRRTIRTLGMALAKEVARIDVARVKLSDFFIKDGLEPAVSHHAHHMGTTRMARDPRHGVVDENCKVHGVENLYVGGSSVFPTGGGVNPTLTIVMLALRLGKHLKTLR